MNAHIGKSKGLRMTVYWWFFYYESWYWLYTPSEKNLVIGSSLVYVNNGKKYLYV